jgi:large subunit ribosomal protein L21
MYAIVKTGGKQYRVEQGSSLLVERLAVDEGARVSLEPLLYVDDSTMLDGESVAKVKVEAKVLGHERGPKLRVVKFKPKRGYKRRTGHRQELTRLEVSSIKAPAAKAASGSGAASRGGTGGSSGGRGSSGRGASGSSGGRGSSGRGASGSSGRRGSSGRGAASKRKEADDGS